MTLFARRGCNSLPWRVFFLGGHEVTETTYTFTGKPSTVTHTHTASGKTTRTEKYTYVYDAAERVSSVKHKLGSTEVTLASYTYDMHGRMSRRNFHDNYSSEQIYSYNVRSWLTGISSAKFTQTLGYSGLYGGDIKTMSWTANGSSHSYTFGYDGVGRMMNANHGAGAYSELVTSYDKNGNIKALKRTCGSSTLADDLTYTYSGNRITKVEDAAGTSGLFSNGSTATTEYTYDNNGNLTKDLNKGISNITYNCLNLPLSMTFSNGSTIAYTYDANGRKLRTVHNVGGTTTTTDYAGNVIYENGVQKKLLTEEGYVDLTSGTYYYYLKDHQGNNRVVVNSGGTVSETNHYYPFGGTFASGTVQPYKYNGKELDTKAGLNWYDYGARHYDAALGRFTTQDPLAKDYYATSPYGYCLNNPVKFVDPDGKDARISIQGNTITITSNIVLTGSMATEQLAQAYQKNIMDNWGKLTTYKYNNVAYDIVWDVNVRAAKEGESLVHDGTNNFLEVTNYVSKIKFTTNQGEIRGVGWAGKSFDETNPMSHEFGHILGLKDKYKKIKMENGKYDYITLKGWQNNIMGEYSGEGKVEYKNLDYILPNVIHHFNLFENLTDIAPWTEYYFINGNNREK